MAINVQTAVECMRLSTLALCCESMDCRIRSHGIQESEWSDYTGHLTWSPDKRYTMQRVFTAVMYGVLQDTGLEPFPLPLEYVAGCLALTVHPANLILACAWFARTSASRDQEIPSQVAKPDPVTPSELMAAVFKFYNDETCAEFSRRFDSKVAYRTMRFNPAASEQEDPVLPKGKK